jgi:hypothetical protein
MVAPVTPAALHPLTPGNPAYGALKIGAIGGIIALRFALVRRSKAKDEEAQPEPVEVARPVKPHPVSKKKKRKRRS